MNTEIAILDSIDSMNTLCQESEISVMESLVDYIDKQCIIMEEAEYAAATKNSDGIIKKIINAIKRFIHNIVQGIKNFIASITNHKGEITGKGPTASVTSIATEVLKSKNNVPDNIDSWPVPKVNPKYIIPEGPDAVVKESFVQEEVTPDQESEDGVTVTIPADSRSEIKGATVTLKRRDVDVSFSDDKKTLKISYIGFGRFSKTNVKTDGEEIEIPGQDKEWYSSPKVALHIMTHDSTRDKITELVSLALKVVKDRKPEDMKELNKSDKMSKLVKIFLKPESHFYEIPLSKLTEIQAWASKLLTDMEAFTSTDVDITGIDGKTIHSLNMVVRLLMRIQISLNYISSAFKNMSIIDASMYKSIKSIALLDEFVGRCIKAGIPPKYIAYNAWLISDECIRGTGQYKPIFGHARATIFPPNDTIVLKIALSGLGTTSNETESRFTKIFVDMDRIDLIAPVIKDFKNNAIVAMERVHGNFDLSSKTLKEYSKKVNDVFSDYQKKHGSLNIKVGSQHIGNVAYDNKYKVYRSIDYGVHYREKE